MTDTEKAALERRIYDRCLVRVGQLEAEKAALERRIDELCQENERLRADQAHWELGNCPSCPNVADLQEALEQNAKLTNVVGCLMYVKPRDVTSILVNGKVTRIDELLADAGLRWEDA